SHPSSARSIRPAIGRSTPSAKALAFFCSSCWLSLRVKSMATADTFLPRPYGTLGGWQSGRLLPTCFRLIIRSCWRRWEGCPAARWPRRSPRRADSAWWAAATVIVAGWSASWIRWQAPRTSRGAPGSSRGPPARMPSLIVSYRPAAVFLSFGDPAPFGALVRQAGVRLICQVQDVAGARQAAAAGADVIVAQGTEAGGHGSRRATLPLV